MAAVDGGVGGDLGISCGAYREAQKNEQRWLHVEGNVWWGSIGMNEGCEETALMQERDEPWCCAGPTLARQGLSVAPVRRAWCLGGRVLEV